MAKWTEHILWNWRYSREKINALPQIARAGIFVVIFILLYVLFQMSFISGVTQEQSTLKRTKTKTLTQIIQLTNKKRTLSNNLRRLNAIKKQHAALQLKLKKLPNEIDVFSDRMITPEKMAHILKAMLTDVGLKFSKLESIPRQKIEQSKEDFVVTGKTLYRKGMLLSFSGGYFATLNYLKKLEDLKWQFFWDDLNYQVTRYPNANVTLRLDILSF